MDYVRHIRPLLDVKGVGDPQGTLKVSEDRSRSYVLVVLLVRGWTHDQGVEVDLFPS